MDQAIFKKKQEIQLGANQSIIFKFSADLKLEFVNDFFTEFTGYEIHDVVGTSVEEMKHPEMPELISNILYKCVAKTPQKMVNIIGLPLILNIMSIKKGIYNLLFFIEILPQEQHCLL